jgi:hypothetical protein
MQEIEKKNIMEQCQECNQSNSLPAPKDEKQMPHPMLGLACLILYVVGTVGDITVNGWRIKQQAFDIAWIFWFSSILCTKPETPRGKVVQTTTSIGLILTLTYKCGLKLGGIALLSYIVLYASQVWYRRRHQKSV